jgi:hypothetical protein
MFPALSAADLVTDYFHAVSARRRRKTAPLGAETTPRGERNNDQLFLFCLYKHLSYPPSWRR